MTLQWVRPCNFDMCWFWSALSLLLQIIAVDFCPTKPTSASRLSAKQVSSSVKRMIEVRDGFYTDGICIDFMTYWWAFLEFPWWVHAFDPLFLKHCSGCSRYSHHSASRNGQTGRISRMCGLVLHSSTIQKSPLQTRLATPGIPNCHPFYSICIKLLKKDPMGWHCVRVQVARCAYIFRNKPCELSNLHCIKTNLT